MASLLDAFRVGLVSFGAVAFTGETHDAKAKPEHFKRHKQSMTNLAPKPRYIPLTSGAFINLNKGGGGVLHQGSLQSHIGNF